MPDVPRFMPEDWTTMRAAIFSWIRGIVDPAIPVVWKEQTAPSPRKPYVALKVLTLTAPVDQPSQWNDRAIQVVPDPLATAYTVTIAGIARTFNTAPGATAAQVRDGLIGVLTAASIGARSIAPDALALDVAGNVSIVAGAHLVLCIAEFHVGNAETTIQIDAYLDGADGSVPLVLALERSLDRSGVLEALRTAGWAVVGTVGFRKPDAFKGSQWEDRAGFDLRLRSRTRTTELIYYIEDAGVPVGTLAP